MYTLFHRIADPQSARIRQLATASKKIKDELEFKNVDMSESGREFLTKQLGRIVVPALLLPDGKLLVGVLAIEKFLQTT